MSVKTCLCMDRYIQFFVEHSVCMLSDFHRRRDSVGNPPKCQHMRPQVTRIPSHNEGCVNSSSNASFIQHCCMHMNECMPSIIILTLLNSKLLVVVALTQSNSILHSLILMLLLLFSSILHVLCAE